MCRPSSRCAAIALLLSGIVLLGQGCPPTDLEFRAETFTADAGDDVYAQAGDEVLLTGKTDASDQSGMSFDWYQISGPKVEMFQVNHSAVYFVAPEDGTVCEFLLKISDVDGTFGTDSVMVHVGQAIDRASGMIVDAGKKQTVYPGDTVTLHGENCSHPEGLPLTYRWRQYLGPRVILKKPDTTNPYFTAPPVINNTVMGFTLEISVIGGREVLDTAEVLVALPEGQARAGRDIDQDDLVDIEDNCPAVYNPAQTDIDNDGTGDLCDECPTDPNKIEAGYCGCGSSEEDRDADTYPDCVDECPDDVYKYKEGQCGCGEADSDDDGDGTMDCLDECPYDSRKTEAGECGCGLADVDSDRDGFMDCVDLCPRDKNKSEPGDCGCGTADTDTDGDGWQDCAEECPEDANKIEPGACGCGISDGDSDEDGLIDCEESCPFDPEKTEPGVCGCGFADEDLDDDGEIDCQMRYVVVAGVGHEQVAVGASYDDIVAALGQPEDEYYYGYYADRYVSYYDNYGIDIYLINDAVYFVEYWDHSGLGLVEGIGFSSTREEVIAAYGDTYHNDRGTLYYYELGVAFAFDYDDTVFVYAVYDPEVYYYYND